MLLKRLSENEFEKTWTTVHDSVVSLVETKFQVRLKLAESIETMVNEAKEKTGDNYIISFQDIDLHSLKSNNYKIEKKNSYLNQYLSGYKLYDTNYSDKNDSIEKYNSIWEYRIKENKNKIKIDCDVLSYFRDDIDIHKVMQILLFINTHIQDKYKIDKQDINYNSVKEKIKAFEVCQWTEHIQVKTFKNGKIEITIKD